MKKLFISFIIALAVFIVLLLAITAFGQPGTGEIALDAVVSIAFTWFLQRRRTRTS